MPADGADRQHSTAADRLLAWYDRHRRVLPWRALPGEVADPYRVWLSEIMLQQTTVTAAAPYYAAFLARWPDVGALAAAPLEQVLEAWAGLGYYARARNLHRCAQVVVAEHGGQFPDEEAGLLALPGIGAYTAAAIAAIAFGRRAVVMDGNVERVIARLFLVDQPLPAAKPALRRHLDAITPAARAGDFAQGMMDLGATICTPRRPRCILCPLAGLCAARAAGCAEDLPVPAPKVERPTRRGVAFWLTDGQGAVLLRRRPAEGLLGGMMEVPSSPWQAGPMPALDSVLGWAPAAAGWRLLPGLVRHGFTHFPLELTVAAARGDSQSGRWVAIDRLGGEALPTLMAKVARHALKHADG